MQNETRALLVSYAFPPVGGAGVQRVAKLAKYLRAHGVRPSVLTARDPSVPLRDESLLADVPCDVEVTRVRTLEPGYGAKRAAWRASARGPSAASAAAAIARRVLAPDPQVLWQPAAQAALIARMISRRDDVMLVSGPPFSQFLLAPVARAGGLGVVFDYRDEWSTLQRTYEMGTPRGDSLEGALLRCAHAVVTATDEFRANLLHRFPRLDPARVHSIPNGYDPDDFPRALPDPPRDRFVATYAGTVFALTSARGLVGALRLLRDRDREVARALRVRFVGRVVETEERAFDGAESLGVERVTYVPHAEVLAHLAASHLALCILDDVPGAERVYPAKIFELMHLGRPVLILAPPQSALARLARRHALGDVVHPRDEQAIASAFGARVRAWLRGDGAAGSWRNATGIERYDRRTLAGEFAGVLREAAACARRRGS